MKYEFYVAGLRYHDYAKVLPFIEKGDEVRLSLDPDNKYDRYAVKIAYLRGGKLYTLGYVPMRKDLSRKISRDLNAALSDRDRPNDHPFFGVITYHGTEVPSHEALKVEVSFDE